jgi:hypothetical protein
MCRNNPSNSEVTVKPQLKQNPGTNAKKTGKSPDTDITTGINQQ